VTYLNTESVEWLRSGEEVEVGQSTACNETSLCNTTGKKGATKSWEWMESEWR